MTKIIIVDYSLEIVIAIILNRFMPLFEAACHIFIYIFIYIYIYIYKAENTLPELLLLFYSIEPQMSTIHWFGFFFKQKR